MRSCRNMGFATLCHRLRRASIEHTLPQSRVSFQHSWSAKMGGIRNQQTIVTRCKPHFTLDPLCLVKSGKPCHQAASLSMVGWCRSGGLMTGFTKSGGWTMFDSGFTKSKGSRNPKTLVASTGFLDISAATIQANDCPMTLNSKHLEFHGVCQCITSIYAACLTAQYGSMISAGYQGQLKKSTFLGDKVGIQNSARYWLQSPDFSDTSPCCLSCAFEASNRPTMTHKWPTDTQPDPRRRPWPLQRTFKATKRGLTNWF